MSQTGMGEKSSRGTLSSHWKNAIGILILCALILVFYRQIALTNRILVGVDAFTYFYPYRAYAAEAICRGQIPLWNPYLFLGVPFLANPQTAVLYPLNAALCWLPAPRLVAWSIVLHIALAACFSYLYARHSLGLSPLPALLAASAFALGGFLSGQIEHINQLNVSAWFPLLLLLWDLRSRARWPSVLGIGLAIGLGLLAGHSQSSYISLAGLAFYATLPALRDLLRGFVRGRQGQAEPGPHVRPRRVHGGKVLAALLDLLLACLLAAGLAAVQLLPSAELARLSIRSGGLTYRDAVAFSLKPLPRLLRYTFLPPWGGNLVDVFGGTYFTEFLAYIGLLPLSLAAGWCGVALVRGLRNGLKSLYEADWATLPARMAWLAGLGLFLALGLYNPLYIALHKLVPGFDLFRVPARWLFLYAFGAAMLSGVGLQRLVKGATASRLSPAIRVTGIPLAALLVALGELFGAALDLPLAHPTAPEAFSALRTAPAHVLAAQRHEIAPGRFLGMSDIRFDPGDRQEMLGMLSGRLSDVEVYDYVVSAKRKEVLAPNLPLAWGIHAVDGYDGGLLPLDRYTLVQRLFLSEEELLSDGRLGERLKRIPSSRLLSLLGARYVLTDKVHDVWIDDVFYDLAFDAVLDAEGTAVISADDLPGFAATGLGVVSFLENARRVPSGTPVARIALLTREGRSLSFTLHAGQESAEGLYDAGVAHSQARVGHTWRDRPEGSDYAARLDWGTPEQLARIQIEALPFGGTVHVRGLALVDARDGSNVPVLLSTAGRFRQVHSGDVKIYEVLDTLPRAYVVHQTRVVADDEAALALIRDLDIDPSQVAILAQGQEIDEQPVSPSQARIVAYAPREVRVEVSTAVPGYLVLSDAWYPGWVARLDGETVPIDRANLYFRAVHVPAGTHTVVFTYQPKSYALGIWISALALAGVVAAVLIATISPRLRHRSTR